MKSLNTLGASLLHHVKSADAARRARLDYEESSQKVHVAGAGQTLTAAYEQLRNAAENAEEHVLLQRAIGRFYKRQFMIQDNAVLENSGEELAIELTHAGYIPNDSIPEQTIERVSTVAREYYHTYQALRQSFSRTVEAWVIDVLACEIETLLRPDEQAQAFVQFSHEYFLSLMQQGVLFDSEVPSDAELALYVAVHATLLESDSARIRYGLLARFQITPQSPQFVEFNQKIDDLLASETTKHLIHYVDRHGANLRVLYSLLHSHDNAADLLQNDKKFIEAYEKQTLDDYEHVMKKVNRGVVRSIIFLIITKFMLGIAAEVPYDYLTLGHIAWTPLLINLCFPPIYMLLLRLSMHAPGHANTKRLSAQIDTILFDQRTSKQLVRKVKAKQFGIGFEIAYVIAFIVIFGGVASALWLGFGFTIVHLIIFFIFLSATSFLGFRLNRSIRKYETVDANQSGFTALRDFFYMPFVIAGRWISDKYSHFNIIAVVLDMFIELPLKSLLRVIRQWTAFISKKQDEL